MRSDLLEMSTGAQISQAWAWRPAHQTRRLYQRLSTVKFSEAKQIECGPMPNVMAAQPNMGDALCESSVIPFLVPRRKVWLTPAAAVPCSNAANIGTWMESEFCTWQNSVMGQ